MPRIPTVAAFAAAVALGAVAAATASAQSTAAATSPVTVTVGAMPKPLTARGARTVITVRNTTARPLRGLILTLANRKGVRVTLAGARAGQRSRTITNLPARRSVRVSVRLTRVGTAGAARGLMGVTVRQRKKVLGRSTLAFGRRAPAPKPTPRPTPTPTPTPNPGTQPDAPDAPTMVGRHFWGSRYTLNGIRQYTAYFTGPDLVFTGTPEGSWPVCQGVDEHCRPYTFDPATGALTIDGAPATLEGSKLTAGGQVHTELGRATPGARWERVLTYSNSSGICPLYCSYFTEYLTFRGDGTFIRSAVASGSGPIVDWISVPDDSKGTYEVLGDGTLHLAFASGAHRHHTMGIFPDGQNTYPADLSAGVILNNNGYFDISRD